MMGARLCTLLHPTSYKKSKCTLVHPTSDKKSKSLGAKDGTSSSFKEFNKPKCLNLENQRRLRRSMTENVIRKKEMEKAPEKNKKKNVTLEDWIRASPGMKPDHSSFNLKRGEPSYASKQSKKKVHPCLSQCRGSLLSEAKDSLYLDRPLNHHNIHEENKEMSDCSSTMRSLSGKSRKSVSFKLPHDVIFYSPDEPYCKEASSSEETTYGGEDSCGSPVGPNCRGNSSDSTEELVVRLAVDTLPHLF